MYVFERMAKQVLNPQDSNALAYYFFFKEYPNARRYIKGVCAEVYSPFATANT